MDEVVRKDVTEKILCFSQSEYLGVSIEHFDSLGRNEEVHLCHGLRHILRDLHTCTKINSQNNTTHRYSKQKDDKRTAVAEG